MDSPASLGKAGAEDVFEGPTTPGSEYKVNLERHTVPCRPFKPKVLPI